MRIIDLFEDTNFKEDEYLNKNKDGIDYDLAEDLVFYMNNNDDVYRRSVYPTVAKCLEAFKQKKSVRPSVFKQAALECYRSYQNKFPIRALPETLDEELCNEVCEKLFKEICDAESEKTRKE